APPRGSVGLLANGFRRRLGERIVGLDLQRPLELFERLREHALGPIDLAEVAVRVVTGLVAGRLQRRLEPRDRLVEAAELDQIRADVVVRVPEVRVDGDRFLALGDRGLEVALEAVRPAEKGVGLGRGMQGNRSVVEVVGAVEVARHLATICLAEEIDRLLEALARGHRSHDTLLTARSRARDDTARRPRRPPASTPPPPRCYASRMPPMRPPLPA